MTVTPRNEQKFRAVPCMKIGYEWCNRAVPQNNETPRVDLDNAVNIDLVDAKGNFSSTLFLVCRARSDDLHNVERTLVKRYTWQKWIYSLDQQSDSSEQSDG